MSRVSFYFSLMNLESMVALDIGLAIVFAWSMFNGFRKGLIIKVASIVALGLGVYAGFHFSAFSAAWLHETFDWSEQTTNTMAIVTTFLAVVIGVHMIAKALEKVVDLASLSLVNKLGGMVMGLGQSWLLMSAIACAMNIALGYQQWLPKEQFKDSLFYPSMEQTTDFLLPELTKRSPLDAIEERIEDAIDSVRESKD